jgi:tryptophanyl-tRNA synthetase
MSLQDPTSKMSKSAPNPLSRILLTDQPSEINKKLMAALTDSQNAVSYQPTERPGVANLLELLSHFDSEGRSATELAQAYREMGLGQFKKLVGETISETLAPVRTEYERIMGEDGYLDGVAERGAKRARESAEETMVLVREAMGM